ncbi:MAG TPA: LysR family transcriptional regulator [Solirubrobacteraceae bacterium]|nr:LysR family transcriptional regulator [Solirubrobacteraceae bacterium]
MPELRRLRCFVAVATERNFTRAAERLHVAQPALSRQVRLLERELGVELLRRTTREVTLTDGGRYLLERAPALERLLAAARKGVPVPGTGSPGREVPDQFACVSQHPLAALHGDTSPDGPLTPSPR